MFTKFIDQSLRFVLLVMICFGCGLAYSSEFISASYKEDHRYGLPYPRESYLADEQGTVLLYGLIHKTGSITDIQIKKSSGYPRLDAAALETLKTWQFNPAMNDGIPIDDWMEIPIKFSLKSDALPDAKYQLNNRAPGYPAESRKNGEVGTVIIRALVEESGQVKSAEVKQSSGYERLDVAALNAVRTWHFKPGKQNGKNTEMWTDVPVNFSLVNKSQFWSGISK